MRGSSAPASLLSRSGKQHKSILAMEVCAQMISNLEPHLELLEVESETQHEANSHRRTRHTTWGNKLSDVLHEALDMGLKLDKHKTEYRVTWFRRGEPFDEQAMKTIGLHPSPGPTPWTHRVAVTLMPAVSAYDDRGHYFVCKARVKLETNGSTEEHVTP